ncbi:MAG: chromosome segregation protein SMC [Clostridiales bacterium]|nr:chromosome segregation protein SMC [Clostridiales bacterium]
MYLKQIDLLGFKSFTDKTRISLEPGISCIVGPNGSGKSNIADALRWVLGEQSSRSLRGGKMEDVIFAGSKKRKPLGMAEVTITLDNSDGHISLPFPEIAVTRRVYRSGQSDYLINNQACRLKDITNLFLDTGIGVEGISLISQGRVNEIVSAKPEERRVFVEEAAGIVKYRNRKREAVRKLEETVRCLERVGDIIGELESRLSPLESQMIKAKAYLDLREQSNQLEIGLILRLLKEDQNKLAQLSTSLEQLNEEVLRQETLRHGYEAEAERLRLTLQGLDEEIAGMQQTFFQTQTELERELAQIPIIREKQANNEENNRRLNLELEDFTNKSKSKLEESRLLAAQLEATKSEVDRKKAEISAVEDIAQSARQALDEGESHLTALKDQAFALAQKLADLRNQLRYNEQMSGDNTRQQSQLETQEEEISQYLAELMREEETWQSKLTRLAGAEKAKTQDLEKADETAKAKEKACSLAEAAAIDLRYKFHAQNSRFTVMEEMAQSYEGYFPGVRSILLAKKENDSNLTGIIGVAAQLLEVPEQYRQAVETYLGSALQNIVVQTAADARRAITWLKDKKGGRATFLPLDTLKPKSNDFFSAAAKIEGVFGPANQLISSEPAIRPALDFLLGQALLVQNMEIASQAAKAAGYRGSIVTLEGDMINPGGSLTGGSKNQKSPDLLSKKAALEESRRDLANMKELLAQKEDQLEKLRSQDSAARDNLSKIEAEIKETVEAKAAAERELAQILTGKHQAAKQLDLLEEQKAAIKDNAARLAEEKQNLSGELEKHQGENNDLGEEISQLQVDLKIKRENMEEEREDETRSKVELARLQEAAHNLGARNHTLRQELAELEANQIQRQAALTAISKEQTQLRELEAEARSVIAAKEEQIQHQEEALDQKRHGFGEENNQLQELDKNSRELARSLELLRQKLHQEELKKTLVQAEWENEEDRLQEKFQLSYQEASLLPPVNLSRREMKNTLAGLSKEIEELGQVNLGAIEEYAEVSQRYDFLQEQRGDLTAAKQSLDQVIADMDKIMASRFRNAFGQLNLEFAKSFARLFDGGNAELVLSDPQDILATGVELSVHPPGKKVSNYNLLSGGEKALIGIALMFAIMAVRPSPFCLLDEVDAALDEANVERFANYLVDLAAKTQFLMISHRQGTMEVSSSLWGVTMEEEGVSKLVSVRLN